MMADPRVTLQVTVGDAHGVASLEEICSALHELSEAYRSATVLIRSETDRMNRRADFWAGHGPS